MPRQVLTVNKELYQGDVNIFLTVAPVKFPKKSGMFAMTLTPTLARQLISALEFAVGFETKAGFSYSIDLSVEGERDRT
jgi:hypothetical protein